MQIPIEITKVLDSENQNLKEYIFSNFRQSLSDINLNANLIESLIVSVENFKIDEFIKTNESELDKLFTKGFYSGVALDNFTKYILPEIQGAKNIMDVGCGSGGLVRLISKVNREVSVIGVDIHPYAEWKEPAPENAQLIIADQLELKKLLANIKPDLILLTWVFHHMSTEEQLSYLGLIAEACSKGSRVIVLEDSYSNSLTPETGHRIYEKFIIWTEEKRQLIMAFNDWVANCVLGRRMDMPVPFTFRTMEAWIKLFERFDFQIKRSRFIGFPKERDVNNPQALFVLVK
jgi:SAM-dependent methyltransferase